MIFLCFIVLNFACHSEIQRKCTLEMFQEIHKNIYSVYQVPLEPDAIHALLEDIFEGEALTQEYIEHYTARVHMHEEETDIDIKQIDYNHIVLLDEYPTIVRFDVDWSVGGIVTHQKHKHPRVNRYRAIFSLSSDPDGTWHIIATKMKTAERIQRAGISDKDFFEGKSTSGGFLDPLDLIDAELFGNEESN